MDELSLSISRQLRASQLDLEISGFRDELHLLGAIEAWLAEEGLDPGDPNTLSIYENEFRFAFRQGLWTAHISRSINFPEVHTLELGVDLVAIQPSMASSIPEILMRTNNPYFVLKLSNVAEETLVISAVSHISAEPKNMQLAIGVLVNDISSVKDDLIRELLKIPSSESLMNY